MHPKLCILFLLSPPTTLLINGISLSSAKVESFGDESDKTYLDKNNYKYGGQRSDYSDVKEVVDSPWKFWGQGSKSDKEISDSSTASWIWSLLWNGLKLCARGDDKETEKLSWWSWAWQFFVTNEPPSTKGDSGKEIKWISSWFSYPSWWGSRWTNTERETSEPKANENVCNCDSWWSWWSTCSCKNQSVENTHNQKHKATGHLETECSDSDPVGSGRSWWQFWSSTSNTSEPKVKPDDTTGVSRLTHDPPDWLDLATPHTWMAYVQSFISELGNGQGLLPKKKVETGWSKIRSWIGGGGGGTEDVQAAQVVEESPQGISKYWNSFLESVFSSSKERVSWYEYLNSFLPETRYESVMNDYTPSRIVSSWYSKYFG